MRYALLLGLLLMALFTTPALADGNTVRGGSQAAPPCPCPCDTQTMDNYLNGQLAQIANLLGRVGTDEANQIAQKLRDLGAKLAHGTISGEDALKAMGAIQGEIQKAIDDINDKIDKINADDKITPKRKKSMIDALNHQKDLYQAALDGITNTKGVKTMNGLSDLIDCLNNCLNQ